MNRKSSRRLCITEFSWWATVWAVIGFFLYLPSPAASQQLLVGTDAESSFSHYAGKSLCRLVESHLTDVSCLAAPGPGDVDNLTNLRIGSLDMALIDSRILSDAISKKGPFRFLDIGYDNLRAVSWLYDTPVVLVVKSHANIDSLDALKGSRINAGAPKSAENLAFESILEAKKWSRSDFTLVEELPSSQSMDTLAFCHGTLEAMLHVGVHPNDSLRQILRLCDARIGSLNDADIRNLIDKHPEYVRTDIPAQTYPSQQEKVSTFGTRTVLVASRDLEEQAVYRIVEAIYRNRQRLADAHPALSPFPEGARPAVVAGMKPHPGAVRFFSEAEK